MKVADPSKTIEPGHSTATEVQFRVLLEDYFKRSAGSANDKLKNFAKYIARQNLATFLTKCELFKQVLHVHGSIVECGVFNGGGLFSFAQLSSILEPYNHQRMVIGFDTFEGFPELAPEDRLGVSAHSHKGGMRASSFEDLQEATRLFDMNRPLGHMPKVELVRGDVRKTIPAYLKENPHTIVSLLYLDMDIFEPTKAALEHLVERMPKGAVLAFDELNRKTWPGESLALIKTLGVRNVRLQRFPFEPNVSYAVLD